MSELLTQADVDTLPPDTPVTITWSGGNGPHDYYIAVDDLGLRYAAPNTDPNDPLRWYTHISFVGKEPFHTHVEVRPE